MSQFIVKKILIVTFISSDDLSLSSVSRVRFSRASLNLDGQLPDEPTFCAHSVLCDGDRPTDLTVSATHRAFLSCRVN